MNTTEGHVNPSKVCDEKHIYHKDDRKSIHRNNRKSMRKFNTKTLDVLNMQLRVACTDGQMHAARYLLDEGAEPFHIDPFDGRTPLMAAASNNNPDVIVILLCHALDNMSANQYEKGVWVRDSDEYTAAHIAVKHGCVECLSVLLYLHPKFGDAVEDFSCCPSLFSVATMHSLKSNEIVDFLNLRYPHLNQNGIGGLRQDKQRVPMYCEDGSSVCRTWSKSSKYALVQTMKVINSIPKAAMFISMQITFFYSVYILFGAVTIEGYDPRVSILHILGVMSLVYHWLLYSKLCCYSPGLCPVNVIPSDNQRPHIPYDDMSNQTNRTVGYDHALRLMYSTSNIVRKSGNQVLKKGEDESLFSTRFCCHYCRIHRPIRSKHSTTLKRCIPHYDHYCIFLKNHVGRDNYSYYVGSLISVVVVVLPLFLFNIHSYSNMVQADIDSVTVAYKNSSPATWIRPFIAENNYQLLVASLLLLSKWINSWVQYVIGPFFMWCCVWWILFFVLLSFHIYLMCFNLTTQEFMDRYERKSKQCSFSRDSCIVNICDKLFPVEDLCHTKQEVEEFLKRTPLSWGEIASRILRASVDICFMSTMQPSIASNKHKYI